MYWCLDLIRHNIGTHLKHNKYIFDIPIPFCHNLYLSATLKQFLAEFAIAGTLLHHVYMSIRGRIPTCDLIGRLFFEEQILNIHYLNTNVNYLSSNVLSLYCVFDVQNLVLCLTRELI